jgi:lipopolysaccharide/colanic/teichoic acid biosynthesis glycosyltransferase
MECQESAADRGEVRMGSGLPVWKRTLDLALMALCAPGLLLIGSVVALIIKCGSRGPLLFRQTRVGYRGREFTCFKFRTMKTDAETESHRRHTQQLIKSSDPMHKLDSRKDPRLIPLGRLIRAGGLDELPQLINVLRGDMSLVGPRPCIPYEYEMYEPWHRRRFEAVPGLTGLWQVSGKNRTTFDEMIRLDIAYAEQLNLWLDLKILLRTPAALWGQYRDLRGARRAKPAVVARPLVKPIGFFRL